MAANPTEVINLALSRLGQRPVTDIDSTTEPDALIMKGIYEGTVFEVLSIIPWNCAVTRASLVKNTAFTNLTNYAHAYDLPVNSIRILDIDGEREIPYRIEGAHLFTDEGAGDPVSINVRYIMKLTDTTLWDELLQESIVIRLAEKACMRITKNLEYTSYLQQQYIAMLTIARQSANEEDRGDISDTIASLNNAKLADILLAKNNFATG